jgi:uncharacterized phage protein (TIGR01671 family)
MRTIKFIGKRLDNGKWITGWLVERPYGMFIPEGKGEAYIGFIMDGADYEPIYDSRKVDPSTVGQFTGLLDKNGKDIFEGDVVRVCRYYVDEECHDITTSGIVRYVVDRMKFEVVPDPDFDFTFNIEDCEVIGNIHDHSELLKTE